MTLMDLTDEQQAFALGHRALDGVMPAVGDDGDMFVYRVSDAYTERWLVDPDGRPISYEHLRRPTAAA